MTDLDSTEIITADESITENSSTNNIKASLQILSGTDPNTFQINKETIIGRSSPSDIIISAPSLSKQHAKITINNGQYFLTDLGSSNKTFQNKVQLQANVCYALHNGDEIKFGDIVCSFQEQNQNNTTTETKIDANPSTQTIMNLYDDQEPTQPVRVWNKNPSTSDVTPKQNGTKESPDKSSSSSFIPHSSSSTTNDDNDNNLIIGSTTLPETVPVVVEPKEDQLEVVSSAETDKNLSKEDKSPSGNEQMITEDSQLNENIENIIDIPSNREFGKEISSEEQMDTDQTTESPGMVIDEKQSEDEVTSTTDTNVMPTDESKTEAPSAKMEEEAAPSVNKSVTESKEKIAADVPEEELTSAQDVEEVAEESGPVSGRGVPRKNARRARGRRGAAARARVVSTRIHGGRRQPIVPPTVTNEDNNTTLEETATTETEESPKKSTVTPKIKEKKSIVTPPNQESSQTNTPSNVRISARIKERASSGRNRQFPYTDDYVDLDNIEKQAKAKSTPTPTTTTTTGRKSNRGRPSASPEKRISLRQQPIDASENSEQKDNANVYEEIDTIPTPKTADRKRKSTTPISAVTTKRSRLPTPQTVPTISTRRKQTSTIEQSPTVAKPNRRTTGGQQQPATTTTTVTTPKRGRKSSTKLATSSEQAPEKQSSATDRPVRIALSSHLNFDQHHFDTLRKLGFEIMDESCQVDALVVDRIRRTKKFFMCLARGAHILSPAWIDAMIKENRYIPYEKYYLEDTNAETRYGFQLRESVRLAKQGPIFKNQKFFCTKDTSPPYDDLKDIIEAAGGKLVDKVNMTKPGKDIICIVGQIHKNEYEDLFKKGVPIVSEEFILSGISKQKLDFDAFSLFQNATTVKSNIGK